MLQLLAPGCNQSSMGSIVNRVYAELPDDELCVTIPGKDVAGVVDAMGMIELKWGESVSRSTTVAGRCRGRPRRSSSAR